MFSKMNTKWLGGIFIVLLTIALLIVLRENKAPVNRNRTFKSELTDFDTAKVTSLIIYPKSKNNQIILNKEGLFWKVSSDGKMHNADESAVKSMLTSIITLKATRIASKDKISWNQYEVSDSLATRVQALAGKKIVADVYIGKFNYQPYENPNPYMRQQGKMTSYVRLSGNKEVYAVEGILGISFNREVSDFLNRSLIKSEKDNWNKLAFIMPNGSFNLVKQGEKWMVDGFLADSTSVDKYLSSIAWLNSSDIIDEPAIENTEPEYILSIEGNNMPAAIKIKAFKTDTINMYGVTSSINEGTYFSGKQSGLMNKIFVAKEQFFKKEETKK